MHIHINTLSHKRTLSNLSLTHTPRRVLLNFLRCSLLLASYTAFTFRNEDYKEPTTTTTTTLTPTRTHIHKHAYIHTPAHTNSHASFPLHFSSNGRRIDDTHTRARTRTQTKKLAAELGDAAEQAKKGVPSLRNATPHSSRRCGDYIDFSEINSTHW